VQFSHFLCAIFWWHLVVAVVVAAATATIIVVVLDIRVYKARMIISRMLHWVVMLIIWQEKMLLLLRRIRFYVATEILLLIVSLRQQEIWCLSGAEVICRLVRRLQLVSHDWRKRAIRRQVKELWAVMWKQWTAATTRFVICVIYGK